MKTPSTNIQAPEKLQASSFQNNNAARLLFEIWSFSGCWSLVLGAFLEFVSIRVHPWLKT
jgi:hypothetical protein